MHLQRLHLLCMIVCRNGDAGEHCLPLTLHGKSQNRNITLTSTWDSQRIVTQAFGIILEETLGFHVQFRPADAFLTTMAQFSAGISHVDVEVWNAQIGTQRYRTYQHNYHWVGAIGYGGRSGLFVFNHTTTVHTFSDYYKFFRPSFNDTPLAFNDFLRFGDINMTNRDFCTRPWCNGSAHVPPLCQKDPLMCPVILHCMSEYDPGYFEALVMNNGLKLVTVYLGLDFDSDHGEIQSFYQQHAHVIFYSWRPSLLFTRVDAVRVTFPPVSLACPQHNDDIDSPSWCDYPEQELSKISYLFLRTDAPEVFLVLQRYTVPEADLNRMLIEFSKNGGNERQAACNWLLTWSAEKWNHTVPICLREPIVDPRPGDIIFDEGKGSCEEKMGQINCANGTVYESSSNRCVCAQGQFRNGSICESCFPGKFAPTVNMKSCDPCASGQFQANTGASQCERCALGRYSQETGMSQCSQCEGVKTTGFEAATLSSQCVCPEGTYEQDVGKLSGACVECPMFMICAKGSKTNSTLTEDYLSDKFPKLMAGYWSSTDRPFSIFSCENDYRCPKELEGLSRRPGECAPNLERQACSVCKEGFFWSGNQCIECNAADRSMIIVLVSLLALVCTAIIGLYMVSEGTTEAWEHWSQAFATFAFIIFNHNQVLVYLGYVKVKMDTSHLGEVYEFWRFTNNLLSLFRNECTTFVSFKASMLFQSCGPLLILAAAVSIKGLSHIVAHVFRRDKLVMERNRLVNVYFSLMFTFSSAVAAMCTEPLKCIKHPNGLFTLNADFRTLCYEPGEWPGLVVIAIVCVLFYVVGFTTLFGWIIWVATTTRRFAELSFQTRWSFLFKRFRPDCPWWALVYVAKNASFNFAFVACPLALQQIYWILTVVMLYTALAIIFMPYRNRLANVVEIAASVSLMYAAAILSWFVEPYHIPELHNYSIHLINTGIAISFLPFVTAVFLASFLMYTQVIQRKRSQALTDENNKTSIERLLQYAKLSIAEQRDIMVKLGEWDALHVTLAARALAVRMGSRTTAIRVLDTGYLRRLAPVRASNEAWVATTSTELFQRSFSATQPSNVCEASAHAAAKATSVIVPAMAGENASEHQRTSNLEVVPAMPDENTSGSMPNLIS